MADYSELIERLKKMDGPNYAMDREIERLLDGGPRTSFPQYDHDLQTLRYTASVDAALGLVERMLPGNVWIILNRALREVSDKHNRLVQGITAPELTIAILIALLSALQTKEQNNDAG